MLIRIRSVTNEVHARLLDGSVCAFVRAYHTGADCDSYRRGRFEQLNLVVALVCTPDWLYIAIVNKAFVSSIP
jgi:hypothetical protein